MLTLKIGPYHPSLERALVADLRALAREHPFGRFALVVPSHHLLARVQELLALEAGLTVVGLDAFTFHGLALRIYQERDTAVGPEKREERKTTAAAADKRRDSSRLHPVPLADPAFTAYAITRILDKVAEPNAHLGRPTDFPGIARALAASIRDLREAEVDPRRALDAVGEGVFEGDEEEKLVALFRLAEAYDTLLADVGVLDPAALARVAIAAAPASTWLASLKRVLYYGCYDLTNQQLDFFAAVAKTFPTTAYFPCRPGRPAYAFPDHFLKNYLRGLAAEVETLPAGGGTCALGEAVDRLFAPEGDLTESEARPERAKRVKGSGVESGKDRPPAVEIWNTAGADDEVWAVAKEIVKLLDDGVPAHEIAVVARSLGPYAEAVDRRFRAHAIPYWTPAGIPLLRLPPARAVEQFFAVAAEDYDRPTVIELLGSPYFVREDRLPAGAEPRPDLWDLASRRCGIRRGLGEWRRLLRPWTQKPLRVRGDEEDADGAGCLDVPPEQTEALLRGVEALAGALGRIPAAGTWAEMADAAREAVRSRLRLPADAGPDERAAWGAIERIWDGFREWDRLGTRTTRAAFEAAVRDALEAAAVGPADAAAPNAGVRVLDAMAARGHAFRVLFLIGLNEKFFPRVVREDPFLRDGPRRKIAGVLGCKIAEKLAGYEEERLLLACLLAAARDKVICTYQRSDEEGKVQVPSLYLREIRRAAFGTPFPDSARPHTLERPVPRRLLERLDERRVERDALLPAERAVRLGLRGGDLVAFAGATGRPTRLLGQALAVARLLEDYRPGSAAAHDGCVEPPAEAAPPAKPLSPTALETYARCPFQFFAQRRLKLEPLEAPETIDSLDLASVGTLYHDVLETLYGEFAGEKDIARLRPEAVRGRIREIAEKAFRAFERDTPVGYAVVWEALRHAVVANLEAFVAWDLARLGEEGFRPALLEEEGRGEIPAGAGGAPPVACRGFMDRVDVADDGKVLRYRIVDYKTGHFPRYAVVPAALRGEKLQLPAYLIIAQDALRRAMQDGRLPERPLEPAASSYYYIADVAAEGGPHELKVEGNFWQKHGVPMAETLRRLAAGIHAGHFLIKPGAYCRSCDFAAACRKAHPPTVRRSAKDPGWALYRPEG